MPISVRATTDLACFGLERVEAFLVYTEGGASTDNQIP